MLAMKVGAPLLLVGLVVGLVVSIFQAVTQIQEQTLDVHPEDRRARPSCSSSPARGCSTSCSAYTEELYRAIPALVGPTG